MSWPTFYDEKPHLVELIERRWEHEGVELLIARSPHRGRNAYFRCPGTDWAQVPAPGGWNYGLDGNGWMGFDTGHAWDVWPDLASDDPLEWLLQGMRQAGLMDENSDVIWTSDLLAGVMEAIAAIAAAVKVRDGA